MGNRGWEVTGRTQKGTAGLIAPGNLLRAMSQVRWSGKWTPGLPKFAPGRPVAGPLEMLSPRTGGPRDKPQRINAPLLRRYTTLTLAEGALKAASVQPQTVPQSITKLRRQPWFHTVAPLPTGRPDAIPMLRPVSGMLAPGTCSWCATVSPRGTSPLFRPTHSRVAGASRCTIQLRPTRPAV
ncbi:hypothetical protein PGTUg99_003495 [Puccinia graminis f. sp. tritici]|uniref:Uncharacterized protein n=2 Tax=Puccinia graminis f. sp. tritici TaxID=56615 RepID=A0A5B0RJX2_PUCGR|nr:hypothetical protein PGTUg99_003495 [Puccinia graminis f. sp. tritici]